MTGSARTVKRARRLAELLMQKMHAGLLDPGKLSTEEWDKLFGAKQSMIANLQKLVSTLATLPDGEMSRDKPQYQISEAEMLLLKAWLEEERSS